MIDFGFEALAGLGTEHVADAGETLASAVPGNEFGPKSVVALTASLLALLGILGKRG